LRSGDTYPLNIDQSLEGHMTAPPEPHPLSAEAQTFVESMGVYFERYALPRIGGRLLGLLLVADRSLSLDDLASILRVSRASVSTNMRLILAIGSAKLVTRPGDRRDYYQITHDAWERSILIDMDGIQSLRRLAEHGLEAIATSENTAREHLDDLIEFCELVLEERQTTLERWRALQRAKERSE
jgi:DNA-binding transcriptional regulator GbsR (MarR family)